MNRRQLGAKYEERAARYLEDMGCEILERNYRCRSGEIDLIARDGAYLVFAEVKYRKSSKAGGPLEAVNQEKQKRLSRAALWYLKKKYGSLDIPCRFDVVGVSDSEILWVRDAFPYCGYR